MITIMIIINTIINVIILFEVLAMQERESFFIRKGDLIDKEDY